MSFHNQTFEQILLKIDLKRVSLLAQSNEIVKTINKP